MGDFINTSMKVSAMPAPPLMTVEEYLSSEVRSEVKREYLGGVVYAMAGASEAHNRIAATLNGMLYQKLRGSRCEVFGSDMKVRLNPLGDTYFYYPDAMIACDPTDAGHGWRERPAALFEIISEETRRVDEREKRVVYLQLPSLKNYVRIEQDRPQVIVEHRTAESWRAETSNGLESVAHLPELKLELPLAELYERLILA